MLDKQKIVYGSLIAIIVLVFVFFLGAFLSRDHWEKPLIEQIDQYKKKETELTASLAQISSNSKLALEEANFKLDSTTKALDDLLLKYNRKPKIVYRVKDPRDGSKTIDVEFNENGDQVCRKFPDEYLETLNKMIDEANK